MTDLSMAKPLFELFKSTTQCTLSKYFPLDESYSIFVVIAIGFQMVSEVVDTNMVQIYTC